MDNHFDIAIIGLGCAGSHMILELLSHSQTQNLKIAVIDDFSKDSLKKTWSFWERGQGKWDHLVSYSWQKTLFKSRKVTKITQFSDYIYKSIESEKFINFALSKCNEADTVTLFNDRVEAVTEDSDTALIKCSAIHINAKQVFDSRIAPQFFVDKEAVTLQQHFKGWVIESATDAFDPAQFTMMDFCVLDPGTTSFTYVLPRSKTCALVEFTYFSNKQVNDEEYTFFLKKYISEELKIGAYSIKAVEKGTIPMTDYNFSKHNTQKILKIGTAGGWVKPSTGYSFKSAETKACKVVSNYIANQALDKGLFISKYKLLDSTLLAVLYRDNSKGPDVFSNMYLNQDVEGIFTFLDEESTLLEEVKIMLPLTSYAFISAFLGKLLKIFR